MNKLFKALYSILGIILIVLTGIGISKNEINLPIIIVGSLSILTVLIKSIMDIKRKENYLNLIHLIIASVLFFSLAIPFSLDNTIYYKFDFIAYLAILAIITLLLANIITFNKNNKNIETNSNNKLVLGIYLMLAVNVVICLASIMFTGLLILTQVIVIIGGVFELKYLNKDVNAGRNYLKGLNLINIVFASISLIGFVLLATINTPNQDINRIISTLILFADPSLYILNLLLFSVFIIKNKYYNKTLVLETR